MSRLHQFGFEYVADEDRLLFRLNTSDQSEVCVWLTRRFVATMMWPQLRRLQEAEPVVKRQSNPQTRKSIIAFQRQAAIAKTDFSKPFEKEVKARPAGDTPLLAHRMRVRTTAGGQHAIALIAREGKEVSLSVTNEVLHSLCHLLAQAARKAAWDLDLDIEDRASTLHRAPDAVM
jgi:hypothetical protein